MGLIATYDPVLSRVQLAGSALGATATYAHVWRSTNNFTSFESVRGGSPLAVNSQLANVDDYEFVPGVTNWYQMTSYNAGGVQQASFTTTITQDLAGPWLKVPAAPFLNQQVVPSMRVEIGRRARGGVFDVVGRTMPVKVGDVSSSRQFTLQLRTEDAGEEQDLDYLFSAGEILFLQVPLAWDQFPSGYFSHGDPVRVLPPERERKVFPRRRYWSVPLTEVAKPGASVVGSSYTWTSVVADYASWSALIAANASWTVLLNRTGTPSDVIVP